ncbi:cytidylate kinase [Sphingomonas kaistensis]|uniref:Cytidylate kinase n=1 Tax=Sphingomonas kaistensis TaxID=298708 RepID=A0A7X5Y5G2_9SPHN|nr:(d)CMP kinase [Sphingomonas kaistensis]NJC05472.1 cytidylate kinase [Sphingomonas kaistensis]
MATTPLVIAVDGPAASGKGTVARGLAQHYGLPHLDTGKLYRAVALSLLRWGGDPESEFAALRACEDISSLMDDPELKSEMVGGIASRVSAYPAVRAALLERQREFAGSPAGAVLDGRDIGTVIAPDATAKLFVTAGIEERARRRHAELTGAGLPVHLEDILIDLRARDERDSHRSAAPLEMAADALLLDTSSMSADEALSEAIRLVEGRRRP